MHALGLDDRHPLAKRPFVHRGVERRADADLHHPPGIDEALLDRMIKRRAVAKALAKALRPGVDMGVEMDEADRPRTRGERAQQR